MIRHARAAALAGAVLCLAQPAAAAPTEWWRIDLSVNDKGIQRELLLEQAGAHPAGAGVTELRLLMESTTGGAPYSWVDSTVQIECAAGRMQVLKVTAYGADRAKLAEQPGRGWQALPDGRLARFVCQGARDGYVRREGYTAPVG